jgi:dihydroorotate dehydrogenase electron transfer subunit
MKMKDHRDTIALETASILANDRFAGDQCIMKVKAPELARRARAGSFAHLQVDAQRPLRRPISLMRVDRAAGTVEFLYKVLGEGTQLLAQRQPGEVISILGPIGTPFTAHANRPRPLLIGGGVGMPPMVFLADELRAQKGFQPFAIFGSEVPFPFQARPSQFILPGVPAGVTATMPLLEDWGIPCRLASRQGYAGCHEGFVTDLARQWLNGLTPAQRGEVEVFACGPHPMLEAVAKLAREFDLPCQVSLEEFMACGVGGCAGCVVQVNTPQGPAMKRVCVDGPVFDARMVF